MRYRARKTAATFLKRFMSDLILGCERRGGPDWWEIVRRFRGFSQIGEVVEGD